MGNSYKHADHMADIAAMTAMSDIHDSVTWSSWGSPIGLTIFLNGLVTVAILIRYAMLMD